MMEQLTASPMEVVATFERALKGFGDIRRRLEREKRRG